MYLSENVFEWELFYWSKLKYLRCFYFFLFINLLFTIIVILLVIVIILIKFVFIATLAKWFIERLIE